ncbi:hypothetical protein [Paraburkholderia solisilvae]|uniref:Uncharacterized protein n=1 Tax=Paraburkholderia solisilvae TaxID=624376 RepID=A0A6J5E3L9_9BURK|nr:hypothetical protein [Paraburkholderia solisilvae]CAB3759866.1 hypothetical protein LMG29739_03263 [Paraburkholderia solisilvae]
MSKYIGIFATAISFVALAGQPTGLFSFTGLADNGDTAVLRFDPSPATTGRLFVVDDRTHQNSKTFPVTYRVLPRDSKSEGNPRVEITFPDKQSLTIFCDPLSSNCRSDGFVTEGGITFALLWHIDRH